MMLFEILHVHKNLSTNECFCEGCSDHRYNTESNACWSLKTAKVVDAKFCDGMRRKTHSCFHIRPVLGGSIHTEAVSEPDSIPEPVEPKLDLLAELKPKPELSPEQKLRTVQRKQHLFHLVKKTLVATLGDNDFRTDIHKMVWEDYYEDIKVRPSEADSNEVTAIVAKITLVLITALVTELEQIQIRPLPGTSKINFDSTFILDTL